MEPVATVGSANAELARVGVVAFAAWPFRRASEEIAASAKDADIVVYIAPVRL